MGFGKIVSDKACFLSKAQSIDDALKWIEAHDQDSDFNEELVITGINNQESKQKRTKEEIEALAKELSKIQHEKFKQKEKESTVDQEKYRIK